MAILTKTNGAYTVQPGDSLYEIGKKTGRSVSDLLALNPQYKTNPNQIVPGQAVKTTGAISPGSQFSAPTLPFGLTQSGIGNGLLSGIPQIGLKFGSANPSSAQTQTTTQVTNPPAPKNPPQQNPPSGGSNVPLMGGGSPQGTPAGAPQGGGTQSFTQALMDILKGAQQQQQAGYAGLLKQGQDITGQGLDQANLINNDTQGQLNPNDIVGLRQGAINAVNPGELSVENQIKLANAGFANVNDLVNQTLGNYQKEQDRIQNESQFARQLQFDKQKEAGTGGGIGLGGGTGSTQDQLQAILGSNDKKLTAGIRGSIGDVLSVVQGMKDFAESNPEGSFAGLSPIRLPGIFQSEQGRQNRQKVEAINLLVQRWASGAALTEAQTAQVQKLTPDANDTDGQVRAKINGLIDLMYSDVGGKLQSAGFFGFNPSSSEFFGSGASGGGSQPGSMMLNGQVLHLQADGTYE